MKSAIINVFVGAFLFVFGLGFTLLGAALAERGGGYTILIGAIVIGGLQLVVGIIQYAVHIAGSGATPGERRVFAVIMGVAVLAIAGVFAVRSYRDSTGYLIAQIELDDEKSQIAALKKLGARDDPKINPALIKALGHRNDYVRGTAADLLGERRAREAVDALAAGLPTQKTTHLEYARALGRIGDARAAPALMREVERMRPRSDYLVGYLFAALTNLESSAFEEVARGLSSPNSLVREAAVFTLGHYRRRDPAVQSKWPSVSARIAQLRADADENVRKAAMAIPP